MTRKNGVFVDSERLLHTSRVARILGVSIPTTIKWGKEGLIGAVQTHQGLWLFDAADVAKFAAQRADKTTRAAVEKLLRERNERNGKPPVTK